MSSEKERIENGEAILGIEFGSTRIKGVLIDEKGNPIAQGDHEWENRLENGVWTYAMEDVQSGMQDCYAKVVRDVERKYGIGITRLKAVGISGMMHGYLAFDENDELLVPFRTWRNTITEEASDKLTKLFNFHIPQRWSIAHLYQAILNKEAHVEKLAFITTLAGYVHWKLTGEKVLGIGDASGMFPIDSAAGDYNRRMLEQFANLPEVQQYPWDIRKLLPRVLPAGRQAGRLTQEGAKLLDPTGKLQSGALFCPPEGDAGTGMAATNSVARRTGNVSAGTSFFSMIVLDKELTHVEPMIDMVTTPEGAPVAMVHCNNGTSDLNAWVGIFNEFQKAAGLGMSMNELYSLLYNKALEGDPDCGGLLAYGFFSGEHNVGMEKGRPMVARTPEDHFSLANFMRANLFTSLGVLRLGQDILVKEGVKIDRITGHGGFFKTPVVGQKILAACMNAPVSVMSTAGEGGPWGMALLAAYMVNKGEHEDLGDYLDKEIFAGSTGSTIEPDPKDVEGFGRFIERYRDGLPIERAAIDHLN